MLSKYSTRREFLKYVNLLFLFLLNSCGNIPKKEKISLQSSFYPESFKELMPNSWKKENINFESKNQENNRNIMLSSDFILINDGWINKIDFKEFKKVNYFELFENLDSRSKDFLNTFDADKRNKLFPVGIVPYAIIIKNNKKIFYWSFE